MSDEDKRVDGPWTAHFPGNMMWSNAALVTKGMAPYGAVAMGEIDQVCERLRERQDQPEAWNEEWVAMGERLEKVALEAESKGHRTFLVSGAREKGTRAQGNRMSDGWNFAPPSKCGAG
jgi:hypothetical protein